VTVDATCGASETGIVSNPVRSAGSTAASVTSGGEEPGVVAHPAQAALVELLVELGRVLVRLRRRPEQEQQR
jgi:hypothetical protein